MIRTDSTVSYIVQNKILPNKLNLNWRSLANNFIAMHWAWKKITGINPLLCSIYNGACFVKLLWNTLHLIDGESKINICKSTTQGTTRPVFATALVSTTEELREQTTSDHATNSFTTQRIKRRQGHLGIRNIRNSQISLRVVYVICIARKSLKSTNKLRAVGRRRRFDIGIHT